MLKLFLDHYKTYDENGSNVPKRTIIRLSVTCLLLAMLTSLLEADFGTLISTIVTAVSVLTGFTFSALFSNNALPPTSLPKPRTVEDENDLRILERLSDNFHKRVKFFIFICVLEMVVLIAASLKIVLPNIFAKTINNLMRGYLIPINCTSQLARGILVFLSALIFIEILYTFYRLTETMLSIIERRKTYLVHSNSSGR